MSGISKSSVSKLCKDIDERVNAFLKRPLAGEWPYLWLDATYLKVREGGRIVSVAAIIAVAVTTEGKREIVGLHIGPSEAEPFWSTFLRDLVRRGLKGVKLVISDAHEGLKAAITRVVGATWQRCRVHFMRNALAHMPKGQNTMVAAAIRQVFLQPDHDAATHTPNYTTLTDTTRATVAPWHAERSARRPKRTKRAGNAALRSYVEERLAGVVRTSCGNPVPRPALSWDGRRHGPRQDRWWAWAWSPEQIAKRLTVDFPDDERMRISQEAIY